MASLKLYIVVFSLLMMTIAQGYAGMAFAPGHERVAGGGGMGGDKGDRLVDLGKLLGKDSTGSGSGGSGSPGGKSSNQ